MKASLVAAVAAVIGAASVANAALIPNAISGVLGIGSAVGDGADPNPGSHSNVVNGNGVTVNDPLDSSTWRHSNAWQDGWQHKGATAGSFILDLGSARSSLDKLYIWNVTESGASFHDYVTPDGLVHDPERITFAEATAPVVCSPRSRG